MFYSINSKIGSETSKILALFHAFSGCDTTSSFHGKGKKSAWEALISFPEVKIAFQLMVAHLLDAFDEKAKHFALLERFTVILYDRTSTCNFVNKARQELFCQKNRSLERLPPTRDALFQHVLRIAYQSGIWTTSTDSNC